jgi:hypothetical protein
MPMPSRVASLLLGLPKLQQPVSEVRRGVPRELEAVILRCLRKNASQRFQRMADVQGARIALVYGPGE